MQTGAAARRAQSSPDDDADAYFPVLYLAYPERGGGPSLRVALLRWGLEARAVDGGVGEEDEGEEDREEGYRVHIVEVRWRGGDGGGNG